MASIKDDRGYNQGFEMVKSTRIRMERRAEYMISQMDLDGERNILEIGCGTGEVSYWIAQLTGKNVWGTDLCVPFIEDAQKKFVLPNLKYEVLDFNKEADFKGLKFDYIIGNGILHHLYYNLGGTFASFRKLLKENGKIIFLEPNLYNPYVYLIFTQPKLRKWANLEPDEMAFSKPFITNKLEEAGFKNIKVDFMDFLLPGIPAFLITPSVVVGSVLEKIPIVNKVSQSIYITARK